MYECRHNRSSRSTRLLTAAVFFLGLLAAALYFDRPSRATYAVENAPPQPTAEELEQVEAFSRVIGMVAQIVRPAVVSIRTTSGLEDAKEEEEDEESKKKNDDLERFREELPEAWRRFFGPERQQRRRPRTGMGSGVIIDAEHGYVLTNNHVVEGADKIRVRLLDQREFAGEVLGTDEKTDLAVIKIEPDRLQALKLGDSDAMYIGATVLAVGAPFNLPHTVTKGIISAKGRSDVRIVAYEDFIQTDAAINPGNSGGPLVNLRAEIIGLNTAIATNGLAGGGMGVGFAIPSNMIKQIIPSLIEGKAVVRGYIGLWIGNLSDDPGLDEQLGLERGTQGVVVHDILAGGPAEKAGIEPDDVLLRYGQKKLDSSTKFQQLVTMTAPETTIDVKVWRDGKEITIPVEIEKQADDFSPRGFRRPRPSERRRRTPTAESEELGIKVQELTQALAEKHKWEFGEESGVVVTEVTPAGAAAEEGIQPGDLIQKVAGKKVDGLRDFRRLMKGQSLDKGIRLNVKMQRGGATVRRLIFVKVG